MNADVVQLAPERAVDAAWKLYAGMARQLRDDPKVLDDRDFHVRLARAYRDWRDLFLAQEPQ